MARRRSNSMAGEHAYIVRLDQKQLRAYEGESVAAACFASGELVLSRSLKYHRPRGAYCMEGHCEGCLVRVDGAPSQRACMTSVSDGQSVETQNAYPAAAGDLARAADFLFPSGLDHHHLFTDSAILNKVTNKAVRYLAGLGKIPAPTNTTEITYRGIRCDVCIIGAGPAGLAAFAELRNDGLDVLLLDSWGKAGGCLRSCGKKVEQEPGVVLGATAVGFYPEEKLLVATAPNSVFSISADHYFYATGSHTQPPLWRHNERPGVMSSRALGRLFFEHGVIPGENIALPEYLRDQELCEQLRQEQVKLHFYDPAIPAEVLGDPVVTGLRVNGTDIECDIAVGESGYAPASELPRHHGCKVVPTALGFAVAVNQQFQTNVANVWAAGDVTGVVGPAQARRQGLAAARALLGRDFDQASLPQPSTRNMSLSVPTDPRLFACRCEDVSTKDIARCLELEYSDIEEIKRFTGFGTGPCQGKSCSGLVSLQQPSKEPFTSRQPSSPTTFAHYAALSPAVKVSDD